MAAKATVEAIEPVVTGEPFVIGTVTDSGTNLRRNVVSVEFPGLDEYGLAQGVKSGTVLRLCGRCSGNGRLPEYGHVYGGICFGCGGTGIDKVLGGAQEVAVWAAKRAKGRAARERAKARKADAAKAAFTAWAEANGPLVEALTALNATFDGISNGTYDGPPPGVLYDFAAQVTGGYRPLSEKQTALAVDRLAEYQAEVEAMAARKAAQRYVGEVGAKVTVTGTVVVDKWIEAQGYGWSSSTLLIVEGTGDDAGVTVKWFTSAATGCGRGDTVTITGTVKAHERYEETPQTVVTRAKVKVLAEAQEVTG